MNTLMPSSNINWDKSKTIVAAPEIQFLDFKPQTFNIPNANKTYYFSNLT